MWEKPHVEPLKLSRNNFSLLYVGMHGRWPGQVSLLKILVTEGMGEVWKQSQLGQLRVSDGLQRGELAAWQSNQKCHEGFGAGRYCGNVVVFSCSGPLEG